MKRFVLLALLSFVFACGPVPPPKPPTPPPPTTKVLRNQVVDAATKQPLVGVIEAMHTDLCGDLFSAATDASGQAVFTIPFTCGGGYNITFTAPTYTALAQRFDGIATTPSGQLTFPMPVGNSTTTPSVILLTSSVLPTPTWTVDQLQDLQGDLMIWMPELGRPDYTGILPGARGVDSGWIWSLWIQWYNPADRQRIYDKIKSYGWTHVAIAVEDIGIGPGYHNLRPTTAADQAAYGPLMMTVHRELVANGLIPICAGVAPGPAANGGAELAPGFDPSVCMVAMSDWDNTSWAAERVKKISDTFPNAILYYERPGDPNRASGIDKSPNDPVDASWDITNGGQWLKNLQQAFPRFKGVMYEVNNWPDNSTPDPVSRCVDEIQKAHGFWRDVQEVRFETNTFDKFWNGAPKETYDVLEARLQAAVPFLNGYTSGGASHPIRREKHTTGGFVGELDPHQATGQHLAGDFADWAQTTRITKLTLSTSSVSVEMDNGRPNAWPDTLDRPGMGALLFSYGIAEQINGQWQMSAPVQLWRGLAQSGGSIQDQNVDGQGHGQIPANWFYDGRWGPMNKYQPKEGEVIGFFICAGDCRDGNGGFSPVHERSNIVLFKLPASGQTVILQ